MVFTDVRRETSNDTASELPLYIIRKKIFGIIRLFSRNKDSRSIHDNVSHHFSGRNDYLFAVDKIRADVKPS